MGFFFLQPLPAPPLSPSLPMVISPSSFFQTPAGESAGASGSKEKLDEGEQVGGGTQQVDQQNEENVELQIINATVNREEGNHRS